MRLLLKTYYIGAFDDTSDMTHVLVELDPRDRLDMRAQLTEVLTLPEIYSVTFFDRSPQPVSIGLNGDVPAWFDEDAEIIAITIGASPATADLQIAAPTVYYMPDGLLWQFNEKHGGAAYETTTVSWKMLEDVESSRRGKVSP